MVSSLDYVPVVFIIVHQAYCYLILLMHIIAEVNILDSLGDVNEEIVMKEI